MIHIKSFRSHAIGLNLTEYPPAKTGGYARIYPNFQNCVRCVDLKDNKHDSLHLGRKNAGYLSLDVLCSSKLKIFLEQRSRKTVTFSEQIMSADKYPSIFSCQMKTIVYIYNCKLITVYRQSQERGK